MRILLITMYYSPDAAANAVIMTELAEELAARGDLITVVTTFPHYVSNVIDPRFKDRLIQREESGNIRIIRTYLYTSPNKKSFLVRLLNYVSFNLLSTFAGIFSGSQDIVLAPSPPLTIGLSAYVISRLKGIPYVYNVQDINPDVLIKLGILTNPIGIKFSKWLERFVYNKARHITVLSEGFKQNLLNKDVPENKLTIIQNFVDTNFIKPLSRDNTFRDRFRLQSKFVILYAGNLGHSQNLEHLLECADMLKNKTDLTFVIVGNGSRKPFLEEKAKELDLENLHLIPFQPREVVPEIYAAADISLVTLRKGIALDSVPSKAYTIMASGRPVLAAVDPGSDVWNLIHEAQAGICVEPEDTTALKNAIIRLLNNPNLCHQFGRNGRSYTEKHYTRQVAGEKYYQLLNTLVRNK
jgi:colanic acid biosynthesis glycosyl transferase WcaI